MTKAVDDMDTEQGPSPPVAAAEPTKQPAAAEPLRPAPPTPGDPALAAPRLVTPTLPPRSLLGIFGSLGAASIITQTALLRELLGLLGGFELLFGLALAAWFVALGLGNLLGGRLAARLTPPRLGTLLNLGLVGAALLPLGQLLLLRLGRPLLGVAPGSAVPAGAGLALLVLAFVPFAAWVGLLLPVGQRLDQQATPAGAGPRAAAAPSSGTLARGRLGVAEATGGLLGGLTCSLALAGGLGSLGALGLGATALALALAHSLAGGSTRRFWLLAGATVLLALGGLQGLGPLEGVTQRARLHALAPDATLADAFDSASGSKLVARAGEQRTLWEDGRPTVAIPDPQGDGPAVARLLVQHPAPRRVLLIGGGLGGTVTQLLHAGMEQVVVVLPDALLAQRLAPHLPPADQASLADVRVRLVFDSPRHFLATTADRFDLVQLVVPDPATLALNRFHTREFLALVARRLTPQGTLAWQGTGGPGEPGPELTDLDALLYFTALSVFSEVLPVPGARTAFFASVGQQVLTLDIDELDARLEALPGRAGAFAAPQLEEAAPARVAALRDRLLIRPFLVDRDTRPLTPLAHLLRWTSAGGSGSGEAPGRSLRAAWRPIAQLDHRWPAACLALLLWPAALLLRRRGAHRIPLRAAVGLTLLLVGAAAAAFGLLGLLLYQQLEGSLYLWLAPLLALLLGGMALGAALVTRALARAPSPPPPPDRRLAALGLGLLLLALTLPLLWWALGGGAASWLIQAGVGGLLLLAGALSGAAFPLAMAATASAHAGRGDGPAVGDEANRGRGRALGQAGAALGALLACSVLPLFGVAAATLLLVTVGAALTLLWLRW